MRMRFRYLHLAALLLAAAACGDEPDTRQAWRYESAKGVGILVASGDRWIERTPEGTVFRFAETARTAAHVELRDAGRKLRVRLFADHMEWSFEPDQPWRREHQGGRWVGKRELPPTARPQREDYRIRVAYFVPSDRTPIADYAARIRVVLKIVEETFALDAAARKATLRRLPWLEKDGQPAVALLRGARPAAYYNDAPRFDQVRHFQAVAKELPESFGVPGKQLLLVFPETYEPGPAKIEWDGSIGRGGQRGADGGLAVMSSWILRDEFCAADVAKQRKLLLDETPIPGRTALSHRQPNSPRRMFIDDGFGAVVHEMGHALGLAHDYRSPDDIMGNGFRRLHRAFDPQRPGPTPIRFSADNARLLDASRYLNPAADLDDDFPPEGEVKLAGPLRRGAKSADLELRLRDNVGLTAVAIHDTRRDTVVAGRALAGKTQTVKLKVPVEPDQTELSLNVMFVDRGGHIATLKFSAPAK